MRNCKLPSMWPITNRKRPMPVIAIRYFFPKDDLHNRTRTLISVYGVTGCEQGREEESCRSARLGRTAGKDYRRDAVTATRQSASASVGNPACGIGESRSCDVWR